MTVALGSKDAPSVNPQAEDAEEVGLDLVTFDEWMRQEAHGE